MEDFFDFLLANDDNDSGDGSGGRQSFSESDWTTPSQSDIYEGAIVEVYLDGGKNVGKYEGKAKLIEKSTGWNATATPYLAYEKENENQGPTCYIWMSERWVVEFVESDRHKQGFRTERNIRFFLCKNWKFPSGYCRPDWDEDDYEEEDMELFNFVKDKFTHKEEEE